MENRCVGTFFASLQGAVLVRPTGDLLSQFAQFENWKEYAVKAVNPVASICVSKRYVSSGILAGIDLVIDTHWEIDTGLFSRYSSRHNSTE